MKGKGMSNDRFKFRIWDDTHKHYLPKSDVIIDGRTGSKSHGSLFSVVYNIEQCTGLKDKNGRLVYEGDVVSFSWQLKDNEVCKIVWDKIHCAFACVDTKTGADFITWYSVFENGQSNRCEIIGNIHKSEIERCNSKN
jgi:uncharacterized phage protein (TIGR01671 family)